MSLIRSSVNPNKIALTVKGLSVLVPSLVILLSYFHVSLGADDLNSFIDFIANVFLILGTLISAVVAAYGAGRKIYYSLFPGPVPPGSDHPSDPVE